MADNIVFNDLDVTVEIYDSVIAKWVLTDYLETNPASTAYLRNRDSIQPKLTAGLNVTISGDNEISADIPIDQAGRFVSRDLHNELKLGTDQLLYVGFSGLKYTEMTSDGETIKALYEHHGSIDPASTLIKYEIPLEEGGVINYLLPLPIVLELFLLYEAPQLNAGEEVDYNLIEQLRHHDIIKIILGMSEDGNDGWLAATNILIGQEGNLITISAVSNAGNNITQLQLTVELQEGGGNSATVVSAEYKVLGEGGGSEEHVHHMLINIPDMGEAEVICKSKSAEIQDVWFGDTPVSGAIAPIFIALADDDMEELPTALVDTVFANGVSSVFVKFFDEEEDDLILFGCDDIAYTHDPSKPFRSMTLNSCTVPDGGDTSISSYKVIFYDFGEGITAFDSTEIGGGDSGGRTSDGWFVIPYKGEEETKDKYWGLVSTRWGRSFILEIKSIHSQAYVKLNVSIYTQPESNWQINVLEAQSANNFGDIILASIWLNDGQESGLVLYDPSEPGNLNNRGIAWKVSTPQELDILHSAEGGAASDLLPLYTAEVHYQELQTTNKTIVGAINEIFDIINNL